MSNKVLYSNSNEIGTLIESVTGWEVTPFGSIDEDCPGELLVFDLLFYQLPKQEWTVSELLEKRPEWRKGILSLLKAKHYAYLFTTEWCVMSYLKETDKIWFRVTLNPPDMLDARDCLYGTEFLTFMQRQEIKRLIEPARSARELGERLSDTLKRPVDLGVPLTFRGLCDTMEDQLVQLNREISEWKDRFFFDASETSERALCDECKEAMRVAFYVREDGSQALNWRPHGEDCCRKECKYFKMDIFEDWYEGSDIRESPIERVEHRVVTY